LSQDSSEEMQLQILSNLR